MGFAPAENNVAKSMLRISGHFLDRPEIEKVRAIDTIVPWYHGTMVPWYHGTIVPWYHGTMVKLEPCFVTNGVAFTFPELIVVSFKPQKGDLQFLTCARTLILKEDRVFIENP